MWFCHFNMLHLSHLSWSNSSIVIKQNRTDRNKRKKRINTIFKLLTVWFSPLLHYFVCCVTLVLEMCVWFCFEGHITPKWWRNLHMFIETDHTSTVAVETLMCHWILRQKDTKQKLLYLIVHSMNCLWVFVSSLQKENITLHFHWILHCNIL
jgi:hypothetical protein